MEALNSPVKISEVSNNLEKIKTTSIDAN